jgi:hypothetical protein
VTPRTRRGHADAAVALALAVSEHATSSVRGDASFGDAFELWPIRDRLSDLDQYDLDLRLAGLPPIRSGMSL